MQLQVYQLLVHGRWFSLGTPTSSTTKTGVHDIAEILLKVALNTINQIKSNQITWFFVLVKLKRIAETVNNITIQNNTNYYSDKYQTSKHRNDTDRNHANIEMTRTEIMPT